MHTHEYLCVTVAVGEFDHGSDGRGCEPQKKEEEKPFGSDFIFSTNSKAPARRRREHILPV